ncbi:hypothetical protein JCM10212_003942 [Sporobolomyces blumeae]
MRHGLHLSKLSRPTAHRVLMLRNLVSSLLQHQQVSTTLPKAKAAQKLADQVIGWGKQGGKDNWDRANAFLLNSKDTLTPLFTTFAKRYASRPGGYTRILRAGYRVGDNAPLAVLELVDNQNDLRFENSAKTVGRELAIRVQEDKSGAEGWTEFRNQVERDGPERVVERIKDSRVLGDITRKNVVKALRYRTNELPVAVSSESTTKNLSTSPDVEASSNAETSLASRDAAASPDPVPAVHPATLFLDRAYHHYLRSLAEFRLATRQVPDPNRPVHQLTQRLHPNEFDSAPKPVLTVPTSGRRALAGERTDGWSSTELERADDDAAGRATGRRGGPITRAKGDSSKWNLDRKRRHATVKMDELEREFEQRL